MRRLFPCVLAFALGAGAGAYASWKLLSRETAAPGPDPKNEARPDGGFLIDPETQKSVAVHEAAHAVIAAIVRPHSPVISIEVNSALDEDSGYGWIRHGPVARPETKEELLSDIVEDLAGISADEYVNGAATDGAGYDLNNATISVVRICGMNGLCGSLVYREELDFELKDRCLKLMKVRADRLVQANAGLIRELADALMVLPLTDGKRVMDGERFLAFLKDKDLVTERDLGVTPESCP